MMKSLPQYTPLNMTLTVNDTAIDADENGVYHAYVGKNPGTLTVICMTGTASIHCHADGYRYQHCTG